MAVQQVTMIDAPVGAFLPSVVRFVVQFDDVQHGGILEVFFKMSKQHLGLGDYHLLRYRGIERYLCLVLIAYLLLTHQALPAPGAKAKPNERAELRLPSIPQLQQQLRQRLWNDVIASLEGDKRTRVAAKRLKEVIQF